MHKPPTIGQLKALAAIRDTGTAPNIGYYAGTFEYRGWAAKVSGAERKWKLTDRGKKLLGALEEERPRTLADIGEVDDSFADIHDPPGSE